MARITTTILIVMLLMNGTVNVMATSGLTEDLGVELAPGVDDEMDEIVAEFKQGFNPSVSVVESFISLAVAGGRLFGLLISGLFTIPIMLTNLGFPGYLVTALMAPLYIISTLELVYLTVGRQSV